MSTILTPDLSVNVMPDVKQEVVAKQLDLIPKSLNSAVYKYRQFSQVSGGSLYPTSSTTQSIFNIPGDGIWNFAKSFIMFDLFTSAATNPGYNSLFVDCLPIDSISLQTASGQIIANIQNAQIYSKVSQHLATNMTEYLSRGPVYAEAVIGATFPIGQISGCQPVPIVYGTATALSTHADGNLIASYPTDASITDTAGGADTNPESKNPSTAASGTDVGGRAPQRVVTGLLGGDNNAAVVNIRYRINLKAFLGTILAMDKDVYFGSQNLQLVIYWKPLSNWGFQTADLVGATLSTALLTTSALPAAAAVNKTTTMSNFFLYLAQDINEDNVNELRAQVNSSGISLLIPYTNSSQLTTGAGSADPGSSYTMSQSLTPGMGLGLKRVITVPCNAANTTKRTANTFNVGGVKYVSVQSKIDGKPIQDQKLYVSRSDPWNFLVELIKNSPAGLSQRTYMENNFWLDNFSDCDDSTHFYENDCMESGLKVNQAKTYEITFDVVATPGLLLCQYQTWVRRLIIRASGIEWGN